MVKWILTLVMMTVSISSFSAGQYTDGEGRFYSHEDDSLTFVKKQLLYQAFTDVITKEMKKLGLDSQNFWTRYNEKFEAEFQLVQNNLKEKFGIEEDKEVSTKVRKDFEDALRVKKLNLKSRFGRIERVISSYSVRKMTRSTQMAQSRYMNVSAKVNKKLLTELYYDFTRTEDFRSFNNLFVTVDFKLQDMSWTDLGVKLEKDFTNVIHQYWRNWLLQSLNGVVKDVIVADESMKEKLVNYLKIPVEATAYFDKDKGVLQENTTMAIMNMDDELKQSLWLKIRVDIKKTGDDELVMKRNLIFDGDFILQDLNSKKIVNYYDFITEKASFSFSDEHELSSNSASLVYRLPMNRFKDIKKSLAEMLNEKKRVQLKLRGFRSVGEVESFSKYLQTKGVTLRLSTDVLSIGANETILQVEYRGENQVLFDLLKGLKNKSIEQETRVLGFEDEQNPFILVMRDLSQGKKTQQ
ncbi:hypothetical protein HBN50_11225 [Halobacteriovorax sp. GB3]|uniref:hypothetical protein n=1 Tax=Halobacteriovorax sp. GB3 TaxID=2719615 RepID=UPI0023625E1A|nr:hypothetical protein [Halobacteriovorax sp. GB3]MDD0853671.1 hypothetical protein [Halobacteriovorax sp. GB3]